MPCEQPNGNLNYVKHLPIKQQLSSTRVFRFTASVQELGKTFAMDRG